MKFFFPDSQDQIDPNYDFVAERSPENRVRQRDDRYAHEVLRAPSYDGLLVSKPIVDGLAGASGKYTMAQRHRLYRLGAREFFRLDQPGWSMLAMGDCGAFTYVREETPPYTVDEVIDFYDGCGFDLGVSIDHVILGYDATDSAAELPDWVDRQRLTLELAADFRRVAEGRSCRFEPVGVAQGWSPRSYRQAVVGLQAMGYRYIAMGGMVALKSEQIQECLEAVDDVRESATRLHLLGVTRTDHVPGWSRLGVVSFDSTSPFRQAFKDDRDNYYWPQGHFLAIRVPQVDGNTRLRARISAGQVDQATAIRLEAACLRNLMAYDAGAATLDQVLEALAAYTALVDPGKDRDRPYREILTAMPWKTCLCGVCADAGIQVVVFRGTERNKRRGFHNLHVFHESLRSSIRNYQAVHGMTSPQAVGMEA